MLMTSPYQHNSEAIVPPDTEAKNPIATGDTTLGPESWDSTHGHFMSDQSQYLLHQQPTHHHQTSFYNTTQGFCPTPTYSHLPYLPNQGYVDHRFAPTNVYNPSNVGSYSSYPVMYGYYHPPMYNNSVTPNVQHQPFPHQMYYTPSQGMSDSIVRTSNSQSHNSDSFENNFNISAESDSNIQVSPDAGHVWSELELNALISAVRKHGKRWKRILLDPEFSSILRGRTHHSLKSKWTRQIKFEEEEFLRNFKSAE